MSRLLELPSPDSSEFVDMVNGLSQVNRVRGLGATFTPSIEAWRGPIQNKFELLTADSQRDLTLVLRAGESPEKLVLLRNLTAQADTFLFPDYGIFLVPGKRKRNYVSSNT